MRVLMFPSIAVMLRRASFLIDAEGRCTPIGETLNIGRCSRRGSVE